MGKKQKQKTTNNDYAKVSTSTVDKIIEEVKLCGPRKEDQEIVLLPESKRMMEVLLNATNLKSSQKVNLSFFIG